MRPTAPEGERGYVPQGPDDDDDDDDDDDEEDASKMGLPSGGEDNLDDAAPMGARRRTREEPSLSSCGCGSSRGSGWFRSFVAIAAAVVFGVALLLVALPP
jgi:hypothetical protein